MARKASGKQRCGHPILAAIRPRLQVFCRRWALRLFAVGQRCHDFPLPRRPFEADDITPHNNGCLRNLRLDAPILQPLPRLEDPIVKIPFVLPLRENRDNLKFARMAILQDRFQAFRVNQQRPCFLAALRGQLVRLLYAAFFPEGRRTVLYRLPVRVEREQQGERVRPAVLNFPPNWPALPP